MVAESKVFYAQEYDKSDYKFSSISQEEGPVGYPASDNTYPAVTYLTESEPYEAYVYWPFDLSEIPENAVIDSVECIVLASMTSSVYVTVAEMQLYSRNIPKGTATSFLSETSTYYTLQAGSWTRDELVGCRLKMTAKASNSYTWGRGISFNGASLTITYTVNNEKFMLKLGGAWHDIVRVFKKVNGIWVEQTDLANVIEDGVRYKNGGEIEDTKKTVTITGTGDTNLAYVTINGTKYTSSANISVPIGTVAICTVVDEYEGTYDDMCYIKVNGTTVLEKEDGSYNYTVTAPCTIALSTDEDSSYRYGIIEIIQSSGGSGSANLISFTIDGTSYQAEEGMTWEEWVESSYDIENKWYIDSNYVLCDGPYSGTYYIVCEGNSDIPVSLDTVIPNNGIYTTEFG